MKGQVTVLAPGAEPVTTEYVGELPLEVVQEAVGGYIEVVPYFNTVELSGGMVQRCIVFCNEHGKQMGLRRNLAGDARWDAALAREVGVARWRDGVEIDWLVGSIAIVTGDDEFMAAL